MTPSDSAATGAAPGTAGPPGTEGEPEPAVVGAPSAAAADPVLGNPTVVADSGQSEHHTENGADRHHKGALQALTVAALGVVYGDIGTSPIYTIREAFHPASGLSVREPTAILGVLSLVFWALVLTVSVKYVVLILRADNRGEGGVLALARLASNALPTGSVRQRSLILLASIIGLALFFGDGLITPAISVLSAVEGIQAVQPGLKNFVVPIAVFILTLLFLIQAHGTGRVGRLFGPVMGLWFVTLALLGLWHIAHYPAVLLALNPYYGIALIDMLGWKTFIALGAIVLAVTGGEALYADMGHFGRRPIRIAWFGLVLPALLLNYFGQGALLMRHPETLDHLFFELAPAWSLVPMIALATAATIIASQAVISGVFSLTQQAIQLGLLPRMTIRHTSETEIGQIYIPRVNWILMAGVITLVISFGSSSNIAAAYGIAVTGAMTIDAVLAAIVAASIWKWNKWLAIAVFTGLGLIDVAFFAANSLKIPDGGWFPLAMALFAWFVITTWRRGRAVLYEKLHASALPVDLFLSTMREAPLRVAGTAVFMTGDIETVPLALLHNLKHNKVLHERVLLLQVLTVDVPRVSEAKRVEVRRLGKGFHAVVVRYGFMEQPDVPAALAKCRAHGLSYDEMQTSFFLGRESLLPATRSTLGRARQALFIFLSTTALASKIFFRIPPNRAVELGGQVEV
ncbi:MAG: potassium transporter Kup [Alphaproteobacteria bacterium]|nr:potassium transporter Kup [Alphaproteobacteria bacterium]